MRVAPYALSCAVALVLTAPWGCSYDWSLPAGGAPDATTDAMSDANADADAVVSEEAGIVDALVDTPAEGILPDCPALEVEVQTARADAITCMSNTTACMTEVTDECNCTVVVYAENTATQNYLAAIAVLQHAHCTPQCPGCISPVQEGLCIVSDAGASGSTGLACYQ